jgi:hypothetical protein
MIAWKYKNWRTLGAAAALGLTAGLAACGGEGGENPAGGEGGEGEGGEGAVSAPAPSPATATAPAGGEAGEAGAASAYAGLSGNQNIALRIAHLKGFVMAAERVVESDNASQDDVDAASVLVAQGLLEVYDIAADQFGAVNVATVRAASETGATRAQMVTRLRAANAELDRAAAALTDVDAATTVTRMTDIATGLYQQVNQADYVDAIEYQHSMGAALAARAALQAGRATLHAENARAYADAERELNRFVAMWPQATAPEQPAAYNAVLAQGSRVRLALSPYL